VASCVLAALVGAAGFVPPAGVAPHVSAYTHVHIRRHYIWASEQAAVKDLSITEALDALGEEGSVAGVYSAADGNGVVRFVGMSRNMVTSLRGHVAALPDRIASVRIRSFAKPNRVEMEATKREWIRELGYTPDGNDADAAVWAESVRSTAADVSSPFEQQADGVTASPSTSVLELSVANVDKVLDEVRPYLVADGGNVQVVRVDEESRGVFLQLQGACGSCPSSTVTMKMGIERVLKENFGDLGEVTAVDPSDATAGDTVSVLTPDLVMESLEQLMPAILGLGGAIEVDTVSGGCVTLRYRGPAKVKLGIELALKDNEAIDEVKFVPLEK